MIPIFGQEELPWIIPSKISISSLLYSAVNKMARTAAIGRYQQIIESKAMTAMCVRRDNVNLPKLVARTIRVIQTR